MVRTLPADPLRTLLLGAACAALFAAAQPGTAVAQDARVTATADTNTILVGDQVRVTVSVEHPAGTIVRNVGPADSLRGLEIVRVDSAASAQPGAGGPFTRIYTITAFDTGTFVVPPFVAWYGAASDTAVRSVIGPPVAIFVRGVDVDTSAEIKEIKPPLDSPITFAELLPYLVAAVAAGLLGWLVYYILKKRKRGEKILPAPPPRPPDELALEALRSIEAERLWQRGMVKEYHSALSDVLRTYIERRFAVPAMESTSDEILSNGTVSALPREAVSVLGDVLTKSDLVKFAKFIPPPEQNEKSFAESVSFVGLTGKAAPGARDAAQGAETETAAGAHTAPEEPSGPAAPREGTSR